MAFMVCQTTRLQANGMGMRSKHLPFLIIIALLIILNFPHHLLLAGDATGPAFKKEEIAQDLNIGYAVRLVDVNHDGKDDIVVVDSNRVVWYENPTWKRRTIIQGQTAPDNVCIAAHDIDGDGKVDFALGAGWNPGNTRSGGTLQWLKRGKSLDDPWKLYPIGSEPTVHRINFADTDHDGKKELIVVPLFGRESSSKNNWQDGQPVRILSFPIPKNPTKDRWMPTVLNQSLRVAHNFWPIPARGDVGEDLLVGSYEGVTMLFKKGKEFKAVHLGDGNQENPKGKRGASEIKVGKLKKDRQFIATIEPWHGNQVVVYSQVKPGEKEWQRHVIDDHLRWGHAVSCADLDGDGNDELIIGVRDDPAKSDQFKERRGVRIYRCTDEMGAKWQRTILDNGGIATEDLAVGDLNGDGKPDIVAVGRQTHNMRIYWNQNKK